MRFWRCSFRSPQNFAFSEAKRNEMDPNISFTMLTMARLWNMARPHCQRSGYHPALGSAALSTSSPPLYTDSATCTRLAVIACPGSLGSYAPFFRRFIRRVVPDAEVVEYVAADGNLPDLSTNRCATCTL